MVELTPESDHPQRDTFRWPPRDLPPEPDITTEPADASDPPQDGGAEGSPSDRDRRLAINEHPIGWFETLERLWLGRSDRRTSHRLGLDLSQPDAGLSDRACWRCAQSVGEFETDDRGCATCRGKRLPWDQAFRLGPYRGQIRDAVHDLKYRASRNAGKDLGRALASRLSEAIDKGERERTCVVPVPTTTLRRCFRNQGVDHTLTLARFLGAELKIPVRQMLRRTGSRPQTGLSASARKQNAKRSFGLREGVFRGEGWSTLILVDDVRTTGATLHSCLKCLSQVYERADASSDQRIRYLVATVAVASDGRRRAEAANVNDRLSPSERPETGSA